MKRDLTGPSPKVRLRRIRRSAICSILGTLLILFGLSWIDGSSPARNPSVLKLLSIDTHRGAGESQTYEVQIAPELFGRVAVFGWPLERPPGPTRSNEGAIQRTVQKPIRIASMKRKWSVVGG